MAKYAAPYTVNKPGSAGSFYTPKINYNDNGQPIPIVYGTQRVSGFIIWEGNVSAFIKMSGVSLGAVFGAMYKYSGLALWFGICHGKADLIKVYIEDKEYDKTVLVLPDNFDHFNNGTQSNYPGNSLGESLPTDLNGIPLVSLNALPNIAHGWFYETNSVIFKNDGKSQAVDFVVQRKGPFTILPSDDIYYNGDFIGANPASAILDLLTNKTYGCGLDLMNIRSLVFNGAAICAVGLSGCIFSAPTSQAPQMTKKNSLTVKDINAICYSGSLYLAVGNGGIAYTSSDGIDWAITSIPAKSNLYGCAYGAGKFVMVGESFDGDHSTLIFTSSDGTTWNAITFPIGINFYGLAFVNNLFIALGDSKRYGDATAIVTSSDAVTWTQRAPSEIASIVMRSAAYGAGLYVAVGDDGTTFTSSNGTTWTAHHISLITSYLNSICYANSLFVVVGTGGTILTSSNGSDWTSRTSGTKRNLYSVVWDSVTSLFVAMGDGNVRLTSPTGTTWTLETVGILGQLTINIDSFVAASEVFNCAAAISSGRLYGINATFKEPKEAREYIKQICEATDCILALSPITGELILTAANPFNTSEPAIILTDANDGGQLKDLQFDRRTWRNCNNEIEGEYIEPLLQYKSTKLNIKNEALIQVSGNTKKISTDLSFFVNKDIASYRLHEIRKREAYPMWQGSASVNRRYSSLMPGTLVRITSSEYGVSEIFRIKKVDVDKIDSLDIAITFDQAIERKMDFNFTSIAANYGFNPQYQIPASPNTEILYIQNVDGKSHGIANVGKTLKNLTVGKSVVIWENGLGYYGRLKHGQDYYLYDSSNGELDSYSNRYVTGTTERTFDRIGLCYMPWKNIYGDSNNNYVGGATPDEGSLSVKVWQEA